MLKKELKFGLGWMSYPLYKNNKIYHHEDHQNPITYMQNAKRHKLHKRKNDPTKVCDKDNSKPFRILYVYMHINVVIHFLTLQIESTF